VKDHRFADWKVKGEMCSFDWRVVISQGHIVEGLREEASGAKLHLGVSVITTWSVKTLHHRNRNMRDCDEIWTVGSLEISTVDQAR
jgi:hypothetical protein